MGQTQELFTFGKKIYRKIPRSKWVDIFLKKILESASDILAEFKGFKFPEKFNWDWKFEMLLNRYERGTTIFLQKTVQPGMNVIDIGAHIGYYTRMLAELVGKRGKVYAFEADSDNFSLLKHNTEQYGNVTATNKAVSDRNGQIDFYHVENSTGCHSTIQQEKATKMTVKSVAIDKFIEENKIEDIDLIKIDIEGGEPNAFGGMNDLLVNSNKLKIITEFLPSALLKGGHDPIDFLKGFKKKGFKIYEIQDYGKISEINTEDINDLHWYRTDYVNLFLTKDT